CQCSKVPSAGWLSRLFVFRIKDLNNAAAFANDYDLVGFNLRELFNLLRGWPPYLDQIYNLSLCQSKMHPQIALRHHAASAVHFVHLRMITGHYPDTRANARAVTFGSDEFDFDPILLIAAIVAQ